MSTNENKDTRIDALLTDMALIKEKQNRIILILVGDDMDPTSAKGFAGRLVEVERKVALHDRWKDRALWVIIGISFGSGVGISQMLGLIKIFH